MAVKGFRLSIERMRALVLVGGGVLVVAIATVLVVGHLKRRFLHIDLPKRLGADIQVQSDGFDYTQTSKGKTIFKIHAARAVELKGGDKALLHDVRIELYGEDGSRTDTIAGAEFSYDKDAGQAEAVGPVEITLMRPGVRPAIAAEFLVRARMRARQCLPENLRMGLWARFRRWLVRWRTGRSM